MQWPVQSLAAVHSTAQTSKPFVGCFREEPRNSYIMLWVHSMSFFLCTIFLMLSSSHRPPFSVFWLERKGFSFPAPLSTSHSCDCLQGQVVRGGEKKTSESLSMLLEPQSLSTEGFRSHLAPLSLLPPPLQNFMGSGQEEMGKTNKKARDSLSPYLPQHTGRPCLLLRLE